MSVNDLPLASEPPVAHPLAFELARVIAQCVAPARVLVLGVGSGRNFPVLFASGARIEAIEDDADRLRNVAARFGEADVRSASYAGPYPFVPGFAGALSTHALLHGRRATVGSAIAAVHALLSPGGHFFTTLGSTRDPRYGRGIRGNDDTFTATDGPEAGVTHAFFDEDAVRSLFAGFEIIALSAVSAAETAGRWAHSEDDARALVHWFVHARAT